MNLYLLGPSGSLFRPLKLLESTSLAKVFFSPFGQFAKCNGENEMLTSIYRLFCPFCHFLTPFFIFSLLENHLDPFRSLLLGVMIHFSFWFGNLLGDGSL